MTANAEDRPGRIRLLSSFKLTSRVPSFRDVDGLGRLAFFVQERQGSTDSLALVGTWLEDDIPE